ncbi:MAG: transglutaminase-like domain-containing protein [Oscillospiraceae bacterium]|nr:transglutaminase-like domain-containing protein [Oscillospiraceae bacterium]
MKEEKLQTKKQKPRNPFEFIYSPSRQIISKGAVFSAYFMRAVVTATAVFGLLIFIADAFQFQISSISIFVISLATSVVFAVIQIGIIPALVVLGLTAITALLLTFFIENIIDFIVLSFQTVINLMMKRLEDAGYKSFRPFLFTEFEPDANESTLILIVFIFTGILLTAIFSACIMRKTRFLPCLITGLFICSTVFTYNISTSNFGFALILAALCAIIVLKLYDSYYINYIEPENKFGYFKKHALGGFAGFAALLLAIVIISIPAMTITKRWREIEFINDRLEYARAMISSVIIGDMPNMSDLGFVGNMDTLNPRNTRAESRSFSGKVMMTVESGYNTPVYMRSWVGSYYRGDSWYSATTDEVERYNNMFTPNFTPEQLTYNFYNAINPRFTSFSSSSYGNFIEHGFITEAVDISGIRSTSNLLYVPSIMNASVNLLEHGSRDRVPYSSSWTPYHEGIVTTSWFNFNRNYRVLAFVPIYRHPEYLDNLYKNMFYYNVSMSTIGANINARETNISSIIFNYKSVLDSYEIKYAEPTVVERFFEMDNVERQMFIYENIVLRELYSQYVREHYLALPEADLYTVIVPIVNTLPRSIGRYSDSASVVYIHNTVLKVVNFLNDNYNYTLSPVEPSPEFDDASALAIFLNDTKEGYCVQFATAATMILRAMNIPTRYVEGYVASDFRRNDADNRAGNYITEVHDYNAHAWIEVYIDGMGWMQYEATPTYYTQMYVPYEVSPPRTNSESSPGEMMPEPEYEEIEFEENPLTVEEIANGFRIISGLILAVLGIIGTLIVIKIRINSKNELVKRYAAINIAEKSANLEPEEIRELTKQLADYIMEIQSAGGYIPETGELPAEYARRVSESMTDTEFNDIMFYMEKEEFGPGCSRGELKKIGVYLRGLWDRIYYNMNRPKRLWLRHIKKVI